jgi:hypothetical protein
MRISPLPATLRDIWCVYVCACASVSVRVCERKGGGKRVCVCAQGSIHILIACWKDLVINCVLAGRLEELRASR